MKPAFASYAGLIVATFFLVSQAAAQSNTFSLQADPVSIEVAPGHSNVVTISSAVVSGDAETISFDANGQPSSVTLAFNPPIVQTSASTTLTITANSVAILGTTATITVHGTAPDDSESTTVALRIASYLPQDEWAALSSLYTATNGSAWTTNTGWDFSGSGPNGTECGWFGIACDATPHVIAIALSNNHLTGALPASIQNLPALAQLVVSNNELSGSLDVLDGLSNLQYFGGDTNAFAGTFPQLGSMPNLMGFSVDNNQLTGPMSSLALSSKLVYLSVSANYLSGPFPSLNGLGALRYLYIFDNRFTGVMPNPPNPTQLGSGVVDLCPNFFAPIKNTQWNAFMRTNPWYLECDTDTIFAFGFGAPPTLQ